MNSWLSFWLGLDSNAFVFLAESCALFTEPTSMEKRKSNFKTGSYHTIYIFKNYFITMFLVFSF